MLLKSKSLYFFITVAFLFVSTITGNSQKQNEKTQLPLYKGEYLGQKHGRKNKHKLWCLLPQHITGREVYFFYELEKRKWRYLLDGCPGYR